MPNTRLSDVIKVAEFRSSLRQFLRRTETTAARHGLTPQRYLLLLMIKGAPDGTQSSTVTELTARMHLAQHTVTELVARAETAGLIRREPNARDRRITHLTLTPKGERALASSFAALDADRKALRKLIAHLGP